MGNRARTASALLGLGLLALANGVEFNKEYRYAYTGEMTYLVTEMLSHSPGMAFRSVMRMQPLNMDTYAVKIEDLKVATVHEQDHDWDDESKLTFEKNEKLSEMVERPFVAVITDREDGQGKKFKYMETFARDPIWSVNIKKGMLSFGSLFIPKQKNATYTSHESTAFGDCKVYWNLQQHADSSNSDRKLLNISKVIDHEQCTTVAHHLVGSLPGTPCTTCESTQTHPLTTSTMVKYSLVCVDEPCENFDLEEATGESTIAHAPYTENGNVVKLITKQNFHFLEKKDITEKLEIEGDKEVYTSLNLDLTKEKGFKRSIDMKKREPFVEVWDFANGVKVAIEAFKKVAALHSDEDNQLGMFERNDPAEAFRDAMDMMYTLDYAEMEELFNEVVKTAPEETKAQIQRTFVEVAAAAGHHAGIQFIIDKIQSGEIDTRFIKTFLIAIKGGIAEHSETGLNTILSFCQSDLVAKFPADQLKCMLIYTAMIDDACHMAVFGPAFTDPHCVGQKLQEEAYDKIIPEASVAIKQDYDTLRSYIHMAANLKTHKAVHFLEEIVNDQTVEHLSRMDAMRGLIMITPHHLPFVRKAAAAVYLDRTRSPDIRMLASATLMKSNPPLSLLQSMVDDLSTEPSSQVRSYIVSMIKAFDRAEHPCFKPYAQHIRYVAPKVAALYPSDWKRKDFLTSHMKLSEGYDPTFDYGGHYFRSVIMSDSYLPREIYYGFGDYFANFFFDNLGLTIRQQGMDHFVDHMNNPRKFGAAFGRNLWNLGGRRRLARNAAEAAAAEKTLDEKLHIPLKKYDPMRLEVFVNMFGNDVSLLSFNESHIAPLMSPEYKPGTLLNNLLSVDRDVHFFRNLRDMEFVIPTAFGAPGWLQVQMPAAVSYSRKDSSFDLTTDGVLRLKLNHRLVVDARLLENFGFGLSGIGLALGVGFNKRLGVNLPIKVEANAHMATGKITLNRDFILPQDVLHYEFQPYSYEYYVDNFEKNKQLPLFKDEELKTFDHHVFGDLVGVDMQVKGARLPEEAISSDFQEWLHKFDWRQKAYYWATNPKWHPRKLHISARPAETNPSTGKIITLKHKMVPPEATDRPASSFQEFNTDLPESFVHVWHLTDQLKGTKDRHAQLEFRYSYTPNRQNHWFQLFYERTPFSSHEKDPTKFCMVTKVKQTTTDWLKMTPEQVAHINDDQKIDVDADIRYGRNCENDAQIHAKIAYSHSDQQKEWLKELETGIAKTRVHGLENPYLRLHKNCVEWLQKGLQMPFMCHKFIIHSSQLNKMNLDIKFNEHVHLRENPCLSTIYASLRSRYYPHMTRFFMRPNNTTPGEIHIKSVVREPCIDQRVADIEFQGPSRSSIWKSVPVSWGAHWAPKTATHLGTTNLQSYSRKWFHRYCDIQNHSVATFDGEVYKVPETDCWKILAKDCSLHRLFTLLTREGEDHKKDIQLISNDHIFEITHSGGKISLKIDGTEEALAIEEAKVIKNERGVTTHIVVLHNDHVVMIDSPVYGIHVLLVESAVFVQAAPFYRGKLCGLCGNFNLDRQHEFQTSDGCHYAKGCQFARNYFVPDETCTIPPPRYTSAPHCEKPY